MSNKDENIECEKSFFMTIRNVLIKLLTEVLFVKTKQNCYYDKNHIEAYVLTLMYIELCIKQKQEKYKPIIYEILSNLTESKYEFDVYLQIWQKGKYPIIEIDSVFGSKIYEYGFGYLETQGCFEFLSMLLRNNLDGMYIAGLEIKTTIFRSDPKELSEDDVKKIITKYNFFDGYYNKSGKGINHKYEVTTIKGDKIVIDSFTQLIWQQSGSENYIFQKDIDNWITELNRISFAGFKDWRLPTLEEAMSLVEPEQKNGLYINPIFNSRQKHIWTMDRAQGTYWLWVVLFKYGQCGYSPDLPLPELPNYVRAVRSIH